jgi:succinate-semialdehyde dehydrogenase/glutarate-semialdehyde dehydrogenase
MSNWSDFKRDAIFVGGRWLDKASGGAIPVTDPATGKTLGSVPSAGMEETRAAIEAAHAAFPAWAAKTAQERAVCSALAPYKITWKWRTEPPRDCRRLQLPNRMEP